MKFQNGDVVYHRGRRQNGIVMTYQLCFDDEVVVKFNNGEELRVTESLCVPVDNTLEEIVKAFGRLPEDTSINSNKWEQTYEDLVSLLYKIGNLTENQREMEKIIQMLDKIDTQDGEI